jgi:hypothetical protein
MNVAVPPDPPKRIADAQQAEREIILNRIFHRSTPLRAPKAGSSPAGRLRAFGRRCIGAQ